MDELTIFLIVIGSLAVLVALIYIWYLVADEMWNIACQKGHSSRKYFHYSFWLGMVGWVMVIALPDRNNVAAAPKSTTKVDKNIINVNELPEL